MLCYWVLIYVLGGLRSDHLIICGASLWLYYWRRNSRRLLFFISPLILSGILYDSMRYYADYIRGPVHVAEPYRFERFLFGLPTGPGGRIETPNEFWQRHTHWILDFFCGLAYIIFIFQYMSFCFYLYFAGLWGYCRRATWAFFVVNFFGYCTYYLFAAAPPWYVALHGLGPAKMDTPANPAGAARFDALLGTHFFTGMYGKAADVFGAIPSLHVSYPFLVLIFALQMKRFRVFSVCFALLMCFSAVYLNHHYVIDVILGLVYAFFSLVLVELYYKNRPIDPAKIY